MAKDVFTGNPDCVNLTRAKMQPKGGGQGVSAQRLGVMTFDQPGLDLDDGLGVAE